MIKQIKHWITTELQLIKNLLITHSEYIGILAALLILIISPRLIRQIDPSAAPIDPGVLSGIILAVVAVLIFNSVTWWLIRTIWPIFSDYSTNTLLTDFQTLSPCQRILIYLGFFLSFVMFHLMALLAIL